ncbi:hypothetical protein BDN70DRAFT_877203 [Pholiota conissans]|uniref:Uncharacterized protein n=1 Tax=Pholiota conissans TaxID=109636 RepID=A0A9P5Z455_9AGAR|nr:hypothetical protein BDN70DRAFT_877203 [Pholiota conissans]
MVQKGVDLGAVDLLDNIIDPTAIRKSFKNRKGTLKYEFQLPYNWCILANKIVNLLCKPVSLGVEFFEYQIIDEFLDPWRRLVRYLEGLKLIIIGYINDQRL